MAKAKTPPTREEQIEAAAKTLTEIETTTRVRAWTFRVGKNNYVILSYRHMIDYVNVYPSTRAGRKTSDTPIVSLTRGTDPQPALMQALEILIPEQPVEQVVNNL